MYAMGWAIFVERKKEKKSKQRKGRANRKKGCSGRRDDLVHLCS